MEMKSISGLTCYVKDMKKTASFYGALGFRSGERRPDYMKIYLNWFWVEFRLQKGLKMNNKNTGLSINIKVANVDEFYAAVLSKKLKGTSKPQELPRGGRQFMMRDPDGYTLVFFQ